MAMFAAVARGIADNRQRPRSRNIKRVACQSNEKCEIYLRLKEEDVKELTLEYMGWSNTPQSKSVRDTTMRRKEWRCFCSICLKAKTLV